jgi:hypothetical protein
LKARPDYRRSKFRKSGGILIFAQRHERAIALSM